MTLSRRILGVVALLVVAGAIAWALIAHRRTPDVAKPAPPAVPLATVRYGSVERTLQLTGRAGPAAGTQTKLAFALPGTVGRIDVRLGERVDAGTPLAALDATPYALTARQANADADAAQANAALAQIDRVSVKLRADEAELRRQQRLYSGGVVALRDVQAARAQVAADRADSQGARDQLAAARAQAESATVRANAARYDLSRTTLRAPDAGVIVGIYAQPGQSVDTTTPVVAIAFEGPGAATLDVPVADAGTVKAGDLVRGTAAGQRFDARVSGVAPAVDPATGLATIAIDRLSQTLAPGTPIDATVVTGHVFGSVLPRSAVVEDPQTGKLLVFVAKPGANGATSFDARAITIDAQDASVVRVVSGLRAGERVAAQGAIDLLAGDSGGD